MFLITKIIFFSEETLSKIKRKLFYSQLFFLLKNNIDYKQYLQLFVQSVESQMDGIVADNMLSSDLTFFCLANLFISSKLKT